MEGLYGWVRNITFYLIFMTVLTNILPNHKYDKYLKLFAGMVLILLVLQPVTGSLNLEEEIAYYFGSISFQTEADELKKDILGMEGERLNHMVSQYEEAVAVDLEGMAKQAGFYKRQILVTIDHNQDSETFGKVLAISMTLTTQEPEAEAAVPEIKPVDPITIKSKEVIEKDREVRQKENTSVSSLRTKISEYYSLEVEDVEIKLENE